MNPIDITITISATLVPESGIMSHYKLTLTGEITNDLFNIYRISGNKSHISQSLQVDEPPSKQLEKALSMVDLPDVVRQVNKLVLPRLNLDVIRP